MPESIPVRNPRSGDVDFSIEATTADAIGALASGVRTAQDEWRALGMSRRIDVMQEFKAALGQHRDG